MKRSKQLDGATYFLKWQSPKWDGGLAGLSSGSHIILSTRKLEFVSLMKPNIAEKRHQNNEEQSRSSLVVKSVLTPYACFSFSSWFSSREGWAKKVAKGVVKQSLGLYAKHHCELVSLLTLAFSSKHLKTLECLDKAHIPRLCESAS